MRNLARVVSGIVGAVVALSAAAIAVAAIVHEPRVWFLVMFESAVLVAGVIAALTGLGRFRESPALALACAGGTMLGAAALGWASSRSTFSTVDPEVLFLVHAACAAVLGVCAAVMVLRRESLRPLVVGVALGLACVAVLAGAWAARGQIAGLVEGVKYPLAIIGFVVVMGLLSASVHMVIHAFEVGARGGEAR
jgi:hypothetical protein